MSDPRDHNSCCSFLGVRCELASDSTAASDVRLIGPVRDEASGSSKNCLMEGTGENYLWEVMETLER
jgi:hypothetical protein